MTVSGGRGRWLRVSVALVAALAMTGGMAAQAVEPDGSPPATEPEATPAADPAVEEVVPAAAAPEPPTLGLSFEPNVGQAEPEVDYLARGADYSVFLGPTTALLTLTPPPPDPAAADGAEDLGDPVPLPASMLAMELVGSDPEAPVSAEDRLAATVNYFEGDVPAGGDTDVPTYGRVSYGDVYPGIDLDYYGNEGHLQYDFVVAPGADPGAIALHFAGAESVVLDAGDLVLQTGAGEVRQPPPFVYQGDGDSRQQVDAGYVLEGDRVSFEVGPYDPSLALVIDPVLTYSTYLGGEAGDEGQGLAVDDDGNILIAGDTQASDPPFPGVGEGFEGQYQGGERDGFVAKISGDGSTLLWATYLGGAGEERARSVAVDSAGNVYAAGATFSTGASGLEGGPGFPTTPGSVRETNHDGTGAPANGTSDAYVTKLSPDGDLLYSTLIGGARTDGRTNVAVDATGDLYVSGFTFSTDLLTPGGYQPNISNRADAFFAKVSPDGNGEADLLYGTYLGGRDNDTSRGVAIASDGDAVIAGWTMSDADFPNPAGSHQKPAAGGGDTFVARFDPTVSGASSLVYSAVVGGTGEQDFPYLGNCLALDGDDNPHVTGYALSADFPTTPGAVQPADPDPRVTTRTASGRDAYAFKLSADGATLLYSTYLGSGGEDEGISADVGPSGDGYFTGFTDTRDSEPGDPAFPELHPLEPPAPQGRNAFVTRLAADGSLVYSTQLGGSSTDTGYGIKAHSGPGGAEVATVMGFTSSADFPTRNPISVRHDGSRFAGEKDIFVSQLSHDAGTVTAPRLSVADASVTEGSSGNSTATFTVTRSGDTTGSTTVSYATANGTAIAPGDYTAASTSLTFGAGETSKTIAVTVIGDTVDEPDETFTLTLSGPTGGATLSRPTATGTIIDDDGAPVSEISVADVTVNEGNSGSTTATFTVTRAGNTTGTATVNYTTTDGSATQPSDYLSAVGNLVFDPSETIETFEVTINGDFEDEPNETFTVDLSGATGAIVTDGSATGTIVDDDSPPPGDDPTVSIADASVTEGDSGNVNATFTVSLAPASTGAVKVKFATAGGTATVNLDYQEVSGGLNFAAGETTKTITVPVRGDVAPEPDETFFVRLSAVKGAIAGDSEAVGTIVDDDGGTEPPAAATLAVTGTSVVEGDAGTTPAAFTATRSGDTTEAVTFDYRTMDNTAQAPGDYTGTFGTTTLPAGQTTMTLEVPVQGDEAVEEDEAFLVMISNADNATIPRTTATGTGTIVDDDGDTPPPDGGTGPTTLSIGDVTVTEGDTGTTPAVFTVTRSGTSTGTVTVRFRTVGQTATSGSDYQSFMGTLTFGAGVTTQTITVTVNGDLAMEPSEAFLVELGKVEGATLTRAKATGTILDDD